MNLTPAQHLYQAIAAMPAPSPSTTSDGRARAHTNYQRKRLQPRMIHVSKQYIWDDTLKRWAALPGRTYCVGNNAAKRQRRARIRGNGWNCKGRAL